MRLDGDRGGGGGGDGGGGGGGCGGGIKQSVSVRVSLL